MRYNQQSQSTYISSHEGIVDGSSDPEETTVAGSSAFCFSTTFCLGTPLSPSPSIAFTRNRSFFLWMRSALGGKCRRWWSVILERSFLSILEQVSAVDKHLESLMCASWKL